MSGFRKPFPVKRTVPGHYDDDTGMWIAGAEETLIIAMSVQPLSADEMDALPEGRRTSRSVKIYSDMELYPAKQTAQQNADIITREGSEWEVVSCNAYQMGVISHYKSLAVEVRKN